MLTQARKPNSFILNLLELQSNLLSELATCVVLPLTLLNQHSQLAITRLTPVINVAGEDFLMQTMQLSAIARKQLGKPWAMLRPIAMRL